MRTCVNDFRSRYQHLRQTIRLSTRFQNSTSIGMDIVEGRFLSAKFLIIDERTEARLEEGIMGEEDWREATVDLGAITMVGQYGEWTEVMVMGVFYLVDADYISLVDAWITYETTSTYTISPN